MSKFAFLLAVGVSVGTPALAADMAVKAPPAPQTSPYNWTGFYIGGNAGYGWGLASDTVMLSVPFGFNTWTLAGSKSYRADGVIGGIQAGYNWQAGNYLFGVETDFQGSGQKGSGSFNSVIIDTFVGFPDATTVSEAAKLEWFGTVRGRFGITRNRWLVYGTGGLAYGRVNASGAAQPAPSALGPVPPALWNSSETRIGWTLGAGFEDALTANWSWKVEYLYIDLGKMSAPIAGPPAGTCIGSPGACTFTAGPTTGVAATRFTDNVLRGGLNYKF